MFSDLTAIAILRIVAALNPKEDGHPLCGHARPSREGARGRPQMAGPGKDAADWQVSHPTKRVKIYIQVACRVLSWTFDSDDCLGAKRHLSRAVLNIRHCVPSLKILLRRHTLYQLMLAQCRSSCKVEMVLRSLFGRVDRPAYLDRCLRFQGRLSPYNRECGRCDSVTKASTVNPANISPLSPSYMIATLTQPLDHDSCSVIWSPFSPCQLIATLAD